MPRQRIITGIDIGTDKCSTIIASLSEESPEPQILGYAALPSKGMKKGQIINLEHVMGCLTESIDAAERMAGMSVHRAFVSVTGKHIKSQNSKGVVAVASPNHEISAQDVTRVIEAARAVSLPPQEEILHVIPKDFSVDAQAGIKDPVGMTGIRLEVETHIISGLSPVLKNIAKCIHDLGLRVEDFVFTGLASAEVTLNETEKELGVVSVDIGASTTSILAYVDGTIALSAALPIGARHVTQDIALGCRISIEAAEKVKLELSHNPPQTIKPNSGESKSELQKRRRIANHLDLKTLGVHEGVESLSKSTVIDAIMVPRLKEIMTLIGQELENAQILGEVPAGLVLTGGGAETVGITEVAKRTLNLPARVGSPIKLPGMIKDIHKPAFAANIGLIVYGQRQTGDHDSGPGFELGSLFENLPNLSSLGGIFGKIKKLLKSILP